MILHDLPRECLHSKQLKKVYAHLKDAETEIARLRRFTLKLADRIYGAHEVLGRLAERKDKR